MNEEIPRHLLIAIQNATKAFEKGNFAALATINENLQPLVDAAIAYARGLPSKIAALVRSSGHWSDENDPIGTVESLLRELKAVRDLVGPDHQSISGRVWEVVQESKYWRMNAKSGVTNPTMEDLIAVHKGGYAPVVRNDPPPRNFDPGNLDPDIQSAILFLQEHAFKATYAEDGTKEDGFDCSVIMMQVDPDFIVTESRRLHRLIDAIPGGPWSVEGAFHPHDGTALLILWGFSPPASEAPKLQIPTSAI